MSGHTGHAGQFGGAGAGPGPGGGGGGGCATASAAAATSLSRANLSTLGICLCVAATSEGVANRFASAGESVGCAGGSGFSNLSATFFPIRSPIPIRTSSKSDNSSVLITVGYENAAAPYLDRR